jgi:hypothetical protein
MFQPTCTMDQTISTVDKTGVVVWIRQQGPKDNREQVPCLVILAYINDNEKHQHTSSRHVYCFDRMFGG